MLCLTKESVNTATLVHAPVCVCVCAQRTPHGGLSVTSALEISSGGGSGLNSLPVRIRTGVRTLRSPVLYGNEITSIYMGVWLSVLLEYFLYSYLLLF